MNTNRERTRAVDAADRRAYIRAVFLVSAYAKPASRWLQPVSGSLNNACDIRAGRKRNVRSPYTCANARTDARIYVCIYVYMHISAIYTCTCTRFDESAGGTARLLG